MPLYLWLIIVSMVSTVLVSSWLYGVSEAWNKRYFPMLDYQYQFINDDKTLVFMVGSSLLDHAVLHDQNMISNDSVTLVFHSPRAQYRTTRRYIDSIVKRQPDVLVLQSDMLLNFKDRLEPPREQWHHFSNVIKQRLNSIATGAEREKPKGYSFRCRPGGFRSKSKRHKKQIGLIANRHEDSIPISQEIKDWLVGIQAKGIHIVLVDIPRSRSIESRMSNALSMWRTEVDDLGQKLDIPVLRYPKKIVPSLFCDDGRHMFKRARQIYTRWLTPQLRSIVRERQ